MHRSARHVRGLRRGRALPCAGASAASDGRLRREASCREARQARAQAQAQEQRWEECTPCVHPLHASCRAVRPCAHLRDLLPEAAVALVLLARVAAVLPLGAGGVALLRVATGLLLRAAARAAAGRPRAAGKPAAALLWPEAGLLLRICLLLLGGDGGAAPAHRGLGCRRVGCETGRRSQGGGLRGGGRRTCRIRVPAGAGEARAVPGSSYTRGSNLTRPAIARAPAPPLPLAFSSSAALSSVMDATRIAWMCTGAEKARSRPGPSGLAELPPSSPLQLVPQLPLLLLDSPRG